MSEFEKEEASHELARIPLTDSTFLSLGRSHFNGPSFAYIRVFVISKKYTGPTPKGIEVQVDTFDSLIKSLKQLSAELDTRLQRNAPQEICRISKSSSAAIVLSLIPDERQPGNTNIDIRTFITTEKYTGWTKKGFRLVVDRMDELIVAAETVRDIIRSS